MSYCSVWREAGETKDKASKRMPMATQGLPALQLVGKFITPQQAGP